MQTDSTPPRGPARRVRDRRKGQAETLPIADRRTGHDRRSSEDRRESTDRRG